MKINITTENHLTVGSYDIPESMIAFIEKVEVMRTYWHDGAKITAIELKEKLIKELDEIMRELE